MVLVAAGGFAAGMWLLFTVLFPARPSITTAIARLHQPARPPITGIGWRSWHQTLALHVAGSRVRQDLAVTGTTAESFASQLMTTTLIGGLTGPVVAVAAAMCGTTALVPALVVVAGAGIGMLVPFLRLRAAARVARRDLRHALGAWLDCVVLLIASGIGPEAAMTDATTAGTGPAFRELQRAVTEAAFGANLWAVFDRTGERLGVIELRELAAVAQLASTSGVAIRDSLTTKARSLRARLLAEQEATAGARGRMMFAPIVLIGFAFIAYLVYPLLTSVGLPN